MPLKENPADIGSRGTDCDKLTASNWWTGPKWLEGSPNIWPDTDLHLKNYKEEESPDSDTMEPTFATLEDVLHDYNIPNNNALFKQPLNEHAYARKERKVKGKENSFKKLSTPISQILQQPILPDFDHEETVETPSEIQEFKSPYDRFIWKNTSPFDLKIKRYSTLLKAIGVMRTVFKIINAFTKDYPRLYKIRKLDLTFKSLLEIYI